MNARQWLCSSRYRRQPQRVGSSIASALRYDRAACRELQGPCQARRARGVSAMRYLTHPSEDVVGWLVSGVNDCLGTGSLVAECEPLVRFLSLGERLVSAQFSCRTDTPESTCYLLYALSPRADFRCQQDPDVTSFTPATPCNTPEEQTRTVRALPRCHSLRHLSCSKGCSGNTSIGYPQSILCSAGISRKS